MTEVRLTPDQDESSARNGYQPSPETRVGVEAPLVRYLVKRLIDQRLANAQLHADLAAAAQRAEIEKAARERKAFLASWIAGPHDELGQGELQPASPDVPRAPEACLLQGARSPDVSALVRHQFAVIKSNLNELERQMAIVQSVAERLAERLGGAEADPKLRHDESERMNGELAALCMSTQFAAPLEDPTGTLPDWQEPAGLLAATSVEIAPAMPHPKPRLGASDDEASARAATAVQDTGATIDTSPFATPASLDHRDAMAEAALAPNSFIPRTPMQAASRSTDLDRVAARVADGLRATRKEAIIRQQERIFSVDVNRRAFASSTGEFVPLDPTLDINLLAAKSEVVNESTGGIRFFPDGSSTGGRIELWLLGNRTAVNVRWSTGAVTLEQ